MRRLRSFPAILCADDYGLTAGISRGILELAGTDRLSALSAIVTRPRWREDAARLIDVRGKVAIGVHLNLTAGAPLAPMPHLAPSGELPSIDALTKAALRNTLDLAEIQAEIDRQLVCFEEATGFLPDHVDGHQHVQALPRIRGVVLDALAARFPGPVKPLVRDPADPLTRIAMRGGEVAKGVGLAVLAAGFGFTARRRGFPTNRGFSGFSAYDTGRMYAIELASAMRFMAQRHIVMCHPGSEDTVPDPLDLHPARRIQELDAIRGEMDLAGKIWRIERAADDPVVDWPRAFPDA